MNHKFNFYTYNQYEFAFANPCVTSDIFGWIPVGIFVRPEKIPISIKVSATPAASLLSRKESYLRSRDHFFVSLCSVYFL